MENVRHHRKGEGEMVWRAAEELADEMAALLNERVERKQELQASCTVTPVCSPRVSCDTRGHSPFSQLG